MNFHKGNNLCIRVSQPRQKISRECTPETLSEIFKDLELKEIY